MRHQGGTDTGGGVVLGSGSSGSSDQALVSASRWAISAKVRLLAGLVPTVAIVMCGAIAATRSA